MKILSINISFLVAALLVCCFNVEDASARGRGAGGGRMSGHRSASPARSMNRGPAMSRPSGGHNFNSGRTGGMSRPSMPSRPSTNRPSTNRPSVSRPSTNRPSTSRPSTNRPSFTRPSGTKPSINRPGSGRPNLPGKGNAAGNIADNLTKPGGISRPQPGGGPSSSQLDDFLGNRGPSRPGIATTLPARVPNKPSLGDKLPGIGSGDRPNLGGKVADKLPGAVDKLPVIGNGNRPNIGNGDRPNLGSGNIGSGNLDIGNVNIGNSTDFRKDSKAWISERHNVGNRVRINTGNRYVNVYGNGRYRHGIVGGYPYYGGWGVRGPYYGWRGPTRVAFAAYLGAIWGSATPVYYAYGDGGNVYYENNTVYVNDESAGTPAEYAQEAIEIAAAAPEPEATPESEATEEDWLPLGVFAFTREDVDDSQAMIELAVNKQAVLAGTYYNEATDVSRPLKGTIDQESQRAVLSFADGKDENIVLETGMYNLTQEEAPGLLHLGTEDSNPVLLVRLEAPEE